MPFGEMLIARAIFARFNGGRAQPRQPPHLPLPAHVPPPPGPLLPAPSSLLWICLIVKNQYCPFSFFGDFLLFKPSKWISCLHLIEVALSLRTYLSRRRMCRRRLAIAGTIVTFVNLSDCEGPILFSILFFWSSCIFKTNNMDWVLIFLIEKHTLFVKWLSIVKYNA